MEAMVTMNISLDEATVEKLKAVAQHAGKRVEDIVADFVHGSLDEEERYLAAVQLGIDQVDAGEVVDFDEAFDSIAEKLKKMAAGKTA